MVIGGAGFVGSHLVDRLLADGATVDVIDDYSTGSLANLAEARAVGGLRIHHFDAGSEQTASLLEMRTPDVLFHLAAMPRRPHTHRDIAEAFARTVSLLDAVRVSRIAKVVAALPANVLYGRPDQRELPIKEVPLDPRGVRGIIARSTVDLLQIHREQGDVEFTVLAITDVYGPRQRADSGFVPAMFAAAANHTAPMIVGDGRQTRDFIFIDDTVDALVRAGERGSGLVINIGTGEQTSMIDLWAKIGGQNRVAPTSTSPGQDALDRFAVSPVRARIHLGWEPWTSLDEGLVQTR